MVGVTGLEPAIKNTQESVNQASNETGEVTYPQIASQRLGIECTVLAKVIREWHRLNPQLKASIESIIDSIL